MKVTHSADASGRGAAMISQGTKIAKSPEVRPKRAWVYVAATAIGLSLFAAAIIVGNVAAGAPPEPDENTWAHLFQLAMAAQLPMGVLFLALADWSRRQRVIVLFGAQIVATAMAFAALAWSGY